MEVSPVKDSQNTRAALATGVCLVLALVSGCSTGEAGGPTDRPSSQAGTATAQPSSAPTQEPAPTPSAAPVAVGDVLPAEPEQLPEGIAAFEMPDGSYVAVAADEPLPAQVHSDLVAKGLAVVDVTDVNDNDQLVARSDAAAAYALEQEQATGKKLVMVERLYGYSFASSEVPVWSWYVWSFRDTHNDLVQDYAERDQAVAVAQDWVAARPDPQAWEIVVIE